MKGILLQSLGPCVSHETLVRWLYLGPVKGRQDLFRGHLDTPLYSTTLLRLVGAHNPSNGVNEHIQHCRLYKDAHFDALHLPQRDLSTIWYNSINEWKALLDHMAYLTSRIGQRLTMHSRPRSSSAD
jgi:hypothetical protein